MHKNAKNVIMINKKRGFFVLFLSVFFIFHAFGINNNLVKQIDKIDTNYLQIERTIDAFYYSANKKEFNATIFNSLVKAQETHIINNNDFFELLFAHVDNLIAAHLYVEAGELLNIVDTVLLTRHNNLAYYYYLKGRYFRGIGLYDNAFKYFGLAIKIAEGNNDSVFYGKVLYSKAKTYLILGKRKKALPLLICSEKMLTDTIMLIEAKRRIASSYSLMGDYKNALKSINGALALICPNFNSSSNYYVPKLKNFGRVDILPSILQSRAYIFREMAKGNPDSVFYLKKSVVDSKASINAFEQYKRGIIFEADLIEVKNAYKYFYSKTIEAIMRLHKAIKNDSLLFDALQYAEMDKSSALLRTVQKDIALGQSGIPDSTVEYLKGLYRQLSNVEAKRFEANANVRVFDTSIFKLNLKLYDLVSEITQIEKKLEVDYPAYARLKYEVTPPNINFVLKESNNKAIMEYVVSNEKIYAFLVVDGAIYINHFYFRNNFIESVKRLQQMISDINNIDFSLKELNEFETLSYGIYNDLLGTFSDKIGGKPLLIVPDDLLSLIPFEVLLTKPSKSTSLNYAALPYLVKNNNILYTYSLTLSHMQKKLSKLVKGNQILVMAPGYDGLGKNMGSRYVALRSFCDMDKLGMLKGAQEEAEQIIKHVKGVLLMNNMASEEQFKYNAPRYAILHLAMHTLINNEKPLYSKLIFTPDADKLEDGLLNTYELGNMELNADLVVLSACNTGFGKLNKGEGIIGLTRGFLQAGCKSLLVTLWSVPDEASANLIKGFYSGLRENHTKSFSLSAAKRNYLNSASGMDAHPFFWAGYILIGDDTPIKLDKKIEYAKPVSIILGLLTLSILFWVVYKRNLKV